MKTFKLALIFGLVAFGLSNLAFGSGMRIQEDYQIEAGDGKYVFVMLATGKFGRRKNEIRELYKQSGLYLKSAPQKPMWTVDWYAFKVYVSSDGKHLARMGRGNHGYGTAIAVAFYNEGKLVKEYRVNQLVADPMSLPFSTAGVHWIEKVEFDNSKNKLKLNTRSGEKYIFNIKTGTMIEGKEVTPVKPENNIQKLIQTGKMVELAKLGEKAREDLYNVLAKSKAGPGIKQTTALLALIMGGEDSLPYMERLSKHPEESVRTMALFGLKEMSCIAAKPLLKKMVKDKSPAIRVQAVGLLLTLKDKTVLPDAIKILEHDDKKEVNTLIHTIMKSHIDELVPHMINVTRRIRSYEINNASYWVAMTTCYPFVGEWDPDRVEKWWSENKNKSIDERYIQGIDKALELLEDKDKQIKQTGYRHLRFLTGLEFGNSGGVYETKGLPQWKEWRKSIEGKRPGEVILEKSEKLFKENVCFFGISGFADKRDIKPLVNLYQCKVDKKHNKMRIQHYAETELRRITGIDSYGCNILNGDREKEVMKKWQDFADKNK